MASFGRTLNPSRRSRENAPQIAERSHEVISFNPSSANPRDVINIRIPKLARNVVMVPGSMKLVFDLKTSGHSGNVPVANLARSICRRVVDSLGGVKIQDLDHHNMLRTYQDLWVPKTTRNDNPLYGYSTAQRAKAGVKEVYGAKYCIPMDLEIWSEHGPLYPFALVEDFVREIHLEDINKLLKIAAGGNTTNWNYEIANLELEYDTITAPSLASMISSDYSQGIQYLFPHWNHLKTQPTGDDKTLNINVNSPRLSMTGALILFEETFVDGAFDPEKFSNPKITKVNVTIEGVSYKVFKRGYQQRHLYEEACRLFKQSDMESLVDVESFFTDKFALWIDLRYIDENNLHSTGMNLQNTKDGVQIEIERDTNTNLKMHVFVAADAALSISDFKFSQLFYM